MRKSLVYSLVGIIAVAVISLGATIASGNKPLLGLDLQGGASLVLKPQQKVSNGVLDQAISIIRKRVDALGVAEPDISRQGSTVVIELPGIKNPQDALNTVGQTAELRFRPMLCNVAPYAGAATATTPSTAAAGTPTTAAGHHRPGPGDDQARFGHRARTDRGRPRPPRRAGVSEPSHRRRPRPRHPGHHGARDHGAGGHHRDHGGSRPRPPRPPRGRPRQRRRRRPPRRPRPLLRWRRPRR